MHKSLLFPLLVTAAACYFAGSTFADAPAVQAPTTPSAPKSFRASTLESLNVRNSAGEDLGKIKDLVIDARTGKVTYVALDFGGFLGIGDKLFAVPWSSFNYVDNSNGSSNNQYLRLDVTKERLKNAPGFDKDHWPNMADPQWSTDVDKFYDYSPSARR